MTGLIKFVAAVGLALGIGAMTAHADVPAPAKSTNAEQLGELLKGLGLKIEPVKSDKGTLLGYMFPLQVGDWNLPAMILVNPSNGTVEFSVNTTKITDPHAVPTEAVQKLLKVNAKFNAVAFTINEHNIVVLTASLAGPQASPEAIRGKLVHLIQLLTQTESLWTPDAMGQTQKPQG